MSRSVRERMRLTGAGINPRCRYCLLTCVQESPGNFPNRRRPEMPARTLANARALLCSATHATQTAVQRFLRQRETITAGATSFEWCLAVTCELEKAICLQAGGFGEHRCDRANVAALA